MVLCSSILAWEISMDRGAWGGEVQSTGSRKVGHDWSHGIYIYTERTYGINLFFAVFGTFPLSPCENLLPDATMQVELSLCGL